MATRNRIYGGFQLPTHPCTLATEINCALQRLQQPQGPYVHPRTISFKDGQGKAFWDNLPDRADRDLVGNFTRISHQDRQCWIGFFSVPERNWVGSGNEWDKFVWHCFAAMVVLDETKGKHLFIYDNDTKYGTTTDLRVKTMLWGLQKSLWEELKKRSGTVTVWYSTDTRHRGTNKCLQHALGQAQKWSLEPDRKLSTSGEKPDSRTIGYVQLDA
ncbi:hypothetical protein K4K51_005297 [Colletotrichum sp. SAR 10_75]|nr:hypothetical protein K4K51_005297 [Colletotrichum sp. SAR 10_75]